MGGEGGNRKVREQVWISWIHTILGAFLPAFPDMLFSSTGNGDKLFLL